MFWSAMLRVHMFKDTLILRIMHSMLGSRRTAHWVRPHNAFHAESTCQRICSMFWAMATLALSVFAGGDDHMDVN